MTLRALSKNTRFFLFRQTRKQRFRFFASKSSLRKLENPLTYKSIMSMKRVCLSLLVCLALSISGVRAEESGDNEAAAAGVAVEEAADVPAPASEGAAAPAAADEDDEDEDIDAEIDGEGAPPAAPPLTPAQEEHQKALQAAYVQYLMKGVSVSCRAELQTALTSQEATFTPECDAELAKVSFYPRGY